MRSIRWTIAAIAACAALFLLPTSASAIQSPEAAYQRCLESQAQGARVVCSRPNPSPFRVVEAPLTYQGWATLNLNYCPEGSFCTETYQISTSAWAWTGTSWTRTTIDGGWVYLWPYTGSWRWAWTPKSGWVAISGERFEIRTRIYY